MSSPLLTVILVLCCFVLAAALVTAQRTVDFGGPLRLWLWKREEQRMQTRHRYPETVKRSYWTTREYHRDCPRLTSIGYRVVSEKESAPFIETPMAGMGMNQRVQRRRVPMYFVVYERRTRSV